MTTDQISGVIWIFANILLFLSRQIIYKSHNGTAFDLLDFLCR